jgi:integrase
VYRGTLASDGRDLPLTDAKIRALKPKEKDYKSFDYDGLFLKVTKSGSKLWRFKFRLDGKEGLLAIGKYPEISLADARARRDEARSQVAKGINPSKLKQQTKARKQTQNQTRFEAIAAQFLEKAEKEGRSEATMRKKRWLISLANDDLGKMPIAQINAQHVLNSLRKREALGHYETVRRLRATISAVFRYAVAIGVAETDPTFALKDALIKPQVKHRAAITDEPTLKRFLGALTNYEGRPETSIAFWLLMFFACRPGEIRLAKWEEFDLSQNVWNIPEARMKMRRPHSVPITQEARDKIQELRRLASNSDYLFPSMTSIRKPMSENTLNQALRRMGFEPEEVTAHGFRSTFSTFANQSGLWRPDVIEAYCGRQDKNAVRRAYNRSTYWDERVELANWWSNFLTGLASRV